ncbi:MAG: GntR family transcriptional regulator [Burkholderiaceae bacterium]
MAKESGTSGLSFRTEPALNGGRLVRKTAVDLVVDELRARILSGVLAPGSVLRQEALSVELGVSRIPLREAIRLLSSEGLVDVVAHRGAFVSLLSEAEVRELFDLRLRLEPWLLSHAALRVSQEELDAAEALVAKMDTALPEDWGALNWAFHESLYRPANRPSALNMIRALHEKSERYFRLQVMNAPIRREARAEHLSMIELCRARRAEEAEAALARHIEAAADQIVAIVERLLQKAAIERAA